MEEHPDLPHLTTDGHVHMVDVSEKSETRRLAVAEGYLLTHEDVVRLVKSGQAPKGDVLAVARVAGIMAAKKASEWIPLAHPLALSSVRVDVTVEDSKFKVVALVETLSRTGVEMEALTAVSAALLTLYDMLKARDRAMTITGVRLMEKRGGRSGHFIRQDGDADAGGGVDQ